MTATDIKHALSRKHHKDFYIDNVKTGPTYFNNSLRIIDFWVMNKSWAHNLVTAYEIKVSVSDFNRDSKWVEYLPYCEKFYFAVPKKLISVLDVERKAKEADIPPSHVGLIYIHENLLSTRIIIRPIERKVELPPEIFQYILMNKISPDRYPFFSHDKEYFEAWLAYKRSNRNVGYMVKGKINEELRRISIENENYNRFINQIERKMDIKMERGTFYPHVEFRKFTKALEAYHD